MKKRLGMIDSGLGGIKVLNACVNAYPNYDYVFIGDQQHAPYGDKSKEEIHSYACDLLNYFQSQGIQDVIVACNTICANALDSLIKEYPHMKLHGIIDATVKELPSDVKRVLVLATAKTVAAHAYRDAILSRLSTCEVYEVAAVKLVPLLENEGSQEALQEALEEYLLPYQGQVDAVVLGCTHYPIVKDQIEQIIQVPVYDSDAAVVKSVPFVKHDEPGSVTIYTTKDAQLMHRQIQTIIKKDYDVKELTLSS